MFYANTSSIITGLLSGGTFRQYYRPYFRMYFRLYFRLYFRRNHDKTSWRETAIQNKQATAWLPLHEYNIDCQLSNLLKHFIMTEFPLLHVYSHISRAEAEIRAFLKMDSIILYNFSGGYSPIKNKTPKYQE